MAGNNVIYQWLDRIGLGYAIPHFQAQGVSTPQQLANLNLVDTADSLNIASGKSSSPAAAIDFKFCARARCS